VVDLDGHHPVGDLQQGEGQRTEAGADLQCDIIGSDSGQLDDPAHGVGIGDEILAALLGRAQVQPGGEFPYRGGIQQADLPALGGQTPAL